MRKVKLQCHAAATHYASAACAITEAGLTKGLKHRERMVRSISTGGEERPQQASEYTAWYAPLLDAVCVETRCGGCIMDFTFTWPDLKLSSMSVRSCTCSSGEGPPNHNM